MPRLLNDIMKRIPEASIADLTLDLVKIPSETGTEQMVQEFYTKYLKKAGLEVTLQPIDDTGRSNVIGKIAGTGGGKSLLIQGHLDTIPRGDCVPPSVNRGESRVYGRGSCDCKGSCAAEAVAAKALIESGVKLKGDLYIVGIAGEETTRKPDGTLWKIGAQAMVEQKYPKVDSAIVLECSPPLGLALANKGSMGFEFTVFGADRLLHESAVPFARNPTYWQAEVIEALMKLNRALSKKKNRFVGPPYINVMSVSHPVFLNTIPTSIGIRGTRRMNPGETREGVLKEFDALFGDLCKRSPLKIEMNVTGEPVPWEISPDEPVVKSLQKAYKQVTKKTVLLGGYPANGDGRWYNKGFSEWHKKYNKKGIVTTCFGADHASAHSNIEYVDTKQLETVAKVCALAALDFCGRT